MSVVTAKKPAPAKKRLIWRRARWEKKEESESVVFGGVAGRVRGAIMPWCRRAIKLREVRQVIMGPLPEWREVIALV